MSSFVKALLVVIAGLIVLVVLAVGIGSVWWKKHGKELIQATQEVSTEGSEFGNQSDNQGCLEEAVRRIQTKPGFRTAISTNFFLQTCLASSRPKPGFCRTVPRSGELVESVKWRTAECSRLGLPGNFCGQLLAQVQGYCEAARISREGLKAGGLYSVDYGDEGIRVVKVLVLEPESVHVRLYKETFEDRPTRIDPADLTLGSIEDADGFGIGHIPLSYPQFMSWEPHFLAESSVSEEEREGFKLWTEEETRDRPHVKTPSADAAKATG